VLVIFQPEIQVLYGKPALPAPQAERVNGVHFSHNNFVIIFCDGMDV